MGMKNEPHLNYNLDFCWISEICQLFRKRLYSFADRWRVGSSTYQFPKSTSVKPAPTLSPTLVPPLRPSALTLMAWQSRCTLSSCLWTYAQPQSECNHDYVLFYRTPARFCISDLSQSWRRTPKDHGTVGYGFVGKGQVIIRTDLGLIFYLGKSRFSEV